MQSAWATPGPHWQRRRRAARGQAQQQPGAQAVRRHPQTPPRTWLWSQDGVPHGAPLRAHGNHGRESQDAGGPGRGQIT